MKHLGMLSLGIVALLFTACGDKPKETNNEAVKNPVANYLDSRTDAMSLAEKSLKKNDARVEEVNKALEQIKE